MRRLVCLFVLPTLSLLFCPALSHAVWYPDGVRVSWLNDYQGSFSYGQVITGDGAGGVIVAWRNSSDGNTTDLRAQRLDANGVPKWGSNGVAVCSAPEKQLLSAIMSDGEGGAFVVWIDHRAFGGFAQDIYAQRIDADGTSLWTPDGVLITPDQSYIEESIVMTSDGAGGAIIAWSYDLFLGQGRDIFAQRLDPDGALLWAADGVTLCGAAGNQRSPSIVSDGAGGAIVSWDDERSGPNIYAQRVSATGLLQYSINGNTICSAPGTQSHNAIAPDGANNAIIVWQDARNDTEAIYAQRTFPNGSTQWDIDGVLVCTAAQAQTVPTIVPIASAEAIITWQDARAGSVLKLYSQRLNAAGTRQWSADGIPLCTGTGNQIVQSMVLDYSGGAIIAWEDQRNGTRDIYAQRIDGSGTTQWSSAGVALCSAAQDQWTVALTPDGAGGAFAAWADNRGWPGSSKVKVYAQHVGSGGVVPTGVGRTPPHPITVGEAYPNPFSAQTALDLTLSHDANVAIDVFDVAGRRVRAIDLGLMRAGLSRLTFDGRDDRAGALPSGVYFYRVHAGAETVTRKMVIAR